MTENLHPSPFLLVGNGSYRNRGCEAIVRGTMEILRREFGMVSCQSGIFAKNATVVAQNRCETDSAINSFQLHLPRESRWSAVGFANRWLGASYLPQLAPISPSVRDFAVALQVGGDHYSLDYGKPLVFMAIDRQLQKSSLPVVIWGASVGSFESNRKFGTKMFTHLQALAGIFVRETISYDYLTTNGISDNLHLVADPAFLMPPSEPVCLASPVSVLKGSIGLNLSPMIAFYRGQRPCDVDLNEWLKFCIETVKCLSRLRRPILLIPHVSSEDPGNDDEGLLRAVCEAVGDELAVPIHLVPSGLNAAQLKWIIAQCSVFAGARAHATIAALSSLVPTLTIGYSMKARGINQDIFNHLNYCLDIKDLTPDSLTNHIAKLLEEESSIRCHLAVTIPKIENRALNAGPLLRKIMEKHLRW